MNFSNVREQWFLYDSVLISPWVSTLAHPVPGWYASFAGMGASDEVTFFNARNKSVGLAYNNQESRDQIPYALVVDSISVGFFAPALSSQLGTLTTGTFRGRVDTISSFWQNELPIHSSAIFRTNQDERLKTNCAMIPPGYGPEGFSMGQGDVAAVGGVNGSVSTGGQGVADLAYRWQFPKGIGVPKRATLSVSVRFSEWARDVLNRIWGPGNNEFIDYVPGPPPSTAQVYKPSAFMIQCLITGRREVQQRGAYHV